MPSVTEVAVEMVSRAALQAVPSLKVFLCMFLSFCFTLQQTHFIYSIMLNKLHFFLHKIGFVLGDGIM